MNELESFILSVLAGVVSYYICKWLDREIAKSSLRIKPPGKNGIEMPRSGNSEAFRFLFL